MLGGVVYGVKWIDDGIMGGRVEVQGVRGGFTVPSWL